MFFHIQVSLKPLCKTNFGVPSIFVIRPLFEHFLIWEPRLHRNTFLFLCFFFVILQGIDEKEPENVSKEDNVEVIDETRKENISSSRNVPSPIQHDSDTYFADQRIDIPNSGEVNMCISCLTIFKPKMKGYIFFFSNLSQEVKKF